MARRTLMSPILLLLMFVSHVALGRFILTAADQLPVVRETNYDCPTALYGFRVSLQDAEQRISSMRCSATARQAQDGICPWR